jgi:hypothetical protein
MRSISTVAPAASRPGEGRAGGGPAGRAPSARSRARSTVDSRDGRVFRWLPATLTLHGGGVDPQGDRLPGALRAEPELLPGDLHVARGRHHPVDLHRVGGLLRAVGDHGDRWIRRCHGGRVGPDGRGR